MAESEFAERTPQHIRSLHERDQEKRLIVILEKASLETVKVMIIIPWNFNDKMYFWYILLLSLTQRGI